VSTGDIPSLYETSTGEMYLTNVYGIVFDGETGYFNSFVRIYDEYSAFSESLQTAKKAHAAAVSATIVKLVGETIA
jgi:hypothetical protein